MQRDNGHGGCGVLALHPALWSLFNTFHTKRFNGFAKFSNISLWKDINKITASPSTVVISAVLYASERAP